MGILQLGPLTIKYEWIIFLFAGVITYIALRKLLTNRTFQKEFIDAGINIVIIWFLIYKFSIVLFRPSIIIDNPMGIIYFTGGIKGTILATIISLLYLFWVHKKKAWSLDNTIKAIVYSIVTFIMAYWLIRTLLFVVLIG